MFALALAMGLGLGYPSLRLKGFFLSLTTIGFSEVIRLLASNLPNLTGGTMGFSNIIRLPFFFEMTDKNSYFYINLIFTVVLTLIAFSLARPSTVPSVRLGPPRCIVPGTSTMCTNLCLWEM